MGAFGQSTLTLGNEVTNTKRVSHTDSRLDTGKDEKSAAEKAAAAKELAERYGLTDPNPPPVAGAPDLGDEVLRKAGIDSKLRAGNKQGRKSSFLTGAMGDVTDPIVSKKSALGEY